MAAKSNINSICILCGKDVLPRERYCIHKQKINSISKIILELPQVLLESYSININNILNGDELFLCCPVCKRLFEKRAKAVTNLTNIENELLSQSSNRIRSQSTLGKEEEAGPPKQFSSADELQQPRQSTPSGPVPDLRESISLSPVAVQSERLVPVTSYKESMSPSIVLIFEIN
jgi:hypothetical protein